MWPRTVLSSAPPVESAREFDATARKNPTLFATEAWIRSAQEAGKPFLDRVVAHRPLNNLNLLPD
jgi:hypothetical protein